MRDKSEHLLMHHPGRHLRGLLKRHLSRHLPAPLLFIIYSFFISPAGAQSGAQNLLERTAQLYDRGNRCYVTTGNQYELRAIIDDYEAAIAHDTDAGLLSEARRDSLMQEVNKLWGDYYYLRTSEDTTAYAQAEARFLACMAFAQDPAHRHYNRVKHDEYILHMELAQLYYKQTRYDEACREMETAYTLCSKYVSPYDDELLDIMAQLALCKARTGDYAQATDLIDYVADNYRDTDTPRYGEALRKKAKILMLRNEAEGGDNASTQEAQRCYEAYFHLRKADAMQRFATMTSDEREQYWMQLRPFVTDCYRLEDAAPDLLYDVTLFSKGLLLHLNAPDSLQSAARLSHAVPLAPTWQAVQQRLKADACAIEFVQYEKGGRQQMGALVLRATGSPRFVSMPAPDSMMDYHVGYSTVRERMLSVNVGRGQNKTRIDALYNDSTGLNRYFWNEPLRQAIGTDCRDIWFAPDGYTHLLAIEYLLPSEMNGVTCHRLTSTRRLLEQPRSVHSAQALLVGAVDFQASMGPTATGNDGETYDYLQRQRVKFTPLPRTREEAEAIAHLRHNPHDRLLLDQEATEQAFRAVCSQYPVIHFCTHGLFKAATTDQGTDLKPCLHDNVLSESLLALAGIQHNIDTPTFDRTQQDGALSARELAALNLENTELVVLSCCETGLGYVTADGVYGIQRGLKNAGAKTLVCTLWDADEQASAFFMTRFHQHLADNGSISQAFSQARADMTADDDYAAHPYLRNVFVLIDAID